VVPSAASLGASGDGRPRSERAELLAALAEKRQALREPRFATQEELGYAAKRQAASGKRQAGPRMSCDAAVVKDRLSE
jgi:hypothetical protein